MLAPHIKSNVDKLWNLFWSAGITNPLVAVEQITYLLFLKRLEGIDNIRFNEYGLLSIYKEQVKVGGKDINANECRWSYIEQDKTPQHLIEVVFPWLRELESHLASNSAVNNNSVEYDMEGIGKRMSDAYFQLDPNKGATLQQAIELINKLFDRVDTQGAATDIMGDTFEYLLSEIATAGKNGQFRTPRHIIRCMVEMLDPQPGDYIIDPAAGTGGFLFSSLSHILANHTTPDSLKIEWDGTPHRVYPDQFSHEQYNKVHRGDYYVGLDNDRTMVRIGWMNMILHGIENPQIHQCDSLSKRSDDDKLKKLLASERYQVVLANPPFTGAVDTGDLDGEIFPKAGKTGKKAKQIVTNKSELLFIWRMLDLLSVGGRCAVIVPEGVLFGNTDAHIRLRRELLTEHRVEAVVSLPSGVFQPYAGVKTSILVFQKETRKDDRHQWQPVDLPRTSQVWFYEVEQEAFTLDAKRNERSGWDNDLWDMLEKYHMRYEPERSKLDYYQPEYTTERWRLVDNHTLKAFADEAEVLRWKDKVAAINELFAELPADPEQAQEQIYIKQQPRLEAIAREIINNKLSKKITINEKTNTPGKRESLLDPLLKKAIAEFNNLCDKHKEVFDLEEKVAYHLYQKAYKEATEKVGESIRRHILSGEVSVDDYSEGSDVAEVLYDIARQYARLDGYKVILRSLRLMHKEGVLIKPKHWTAPVRVYREDPEWQSEDGTLKGSHDEDGLLRPAYLTAINLYDEHGKLNEDLLAPDCIESRGWNLSASQYKPFHYVESPSGQSVVEMIREIKKKETEIMQGLDSLLAMVEGEE